MHKIKHLLAVIVAMISVNSYAQKNIEMVIPFPPGGAGTDFIGRTLAKEINARNPGLNVVVINKPGADGIIATQYFLDNPKDKILFVSTGTSLYLKLNNPNVPYDPLALEIIGPYITTPAGLLVNRNKFANWTEFVKYAQKNSVSCGASSTTAAFFGNYVATTYKLKITIIPYTGSTASMRDFLGGHVDCAFDTITVAKHFPTAHLIAVGAYDYTNHYPEVPIVSKDYEFISFMGMSIGKVGDEPKKQIQQTLIDLSRNHDFIQGLAAKGWSIRKPNLTYNEDLVTDYNYLKALQKRINKQ